MFTKLFTFRTHRLIKSAVNFSAKPSEFCSETTLEQAHIDEAVKLSPILSSASTELWQQSHDIFINHGLKTTNFLRIVAGNPSILSRHPSKIVDSFEYWRSCQFGEQFLYLLLTKYPSLLDVSDGRKLLKQVIFLKGYVNTSKNVWKLLMNSPDLIQQSEKSITNKIEYLTNVMRIEIPEIVKSEALSKPLHDIQCRHVFLDRLGLFKPRPPKADPDEPTKNPRLYQITDTSDKRFATKVAHVTMAEFEAFQDLYERESQKKDGQTDQDELDDDDEYQDEDFVVK